VTDNLDNLSRPPASNLTVETIKKIQTTSYQFPTPSLITNAVGPEVILVEGREGIRSVTDETAGGVGVHAEEEGDEQVMDIPESLERLLADPVVSCRVDEQHAKQHDVTCNSTGLGVVNLQSNLRSYLHSLDVVEAMAC
jgi:hypothetical protein